MVGHTDRVLYKSRVLIGVRMGGRRAETLQVIMRDLVRVGAQWSEFQAGFLRLKRKRIYLMGLNRYSPPPSDGKRL